MAIHTELPIYKVAYDLLGVVVQIVKNMPRDFKQSVGGKIRDECIDVATLVFRANVAADKAPHLLDLLGRSAETPIEDLRQTANSYFGLLGQASASHGDRALLANVVRGRGRAVDRDFTRIFA